MKRSLKTIATLTVLAATAIGNTPVSACGGRGGFSGGYARPSSAFARPASGFSRPATNYARSYSASPVRYHQPAVASSHYPAAQPVQPAYQQPIYQSQAIGQAQPIQSRTIQARTISSTTRVVSQRPVSSQPVSSQPVSTGQPNVIGRQTVNTQPRQTQNAMPQRQSQSVASRPAPSQQTTQSGDAQSSALAALASLTNQSSTGNSAPAKTVDATTDVPQFAPATTAAAKTSGDHVGIWTSTLPSKAVITLSLNQNNLFAWQVRDASGKVTKFEGQYRINDGRLTLVRSQDLQQMAGTWKTNNSGFTFKLDGSNNSGLEFRKS